MLRVVFHVLVVVSHFCSFLFYCHLHYSSNVTNHYILREIGKVRFSFLTGWNFTAQTVYFGFCLYEDIVNLSKTSSSAKFSQTKLVQHLKNLLFVAIVFPMSCLVTSMFWSLFLYNRELIYPKALDEVLPLWYNHSLHTNIVVVALVEIWLVQHRYPRRWRCFLAINLFLLAYAMSLLLTYYFCNAWPYPMLWSMSWTTRLCLYFFTLAAAMGFYFLGEQLHKSV